LIFGTAWTSPHSSACLRTRRRTLSELFIDRDERKILKDFWAIVHPTDLLIGHNILEFDLSFLRQRSWVLDIKPSREVNLRKYYTDEVFDTMQIWSNWLRKVKLDDLGGALACGQKTGQGTDVSHWWFAGDLQKIAQYCLDDVRLAYRVFCRLNYFPDRCGYSAVAPTGAQTTAVTVP
jgi:hypothetical protein